ncbi:Signal transduction histidine kinase [Treponema bryantii]|uniref:histidine kinase n=1 Tax=Treponema bryantii TaxID=163 RepID=A0A1H8ZZ72_9SPIR|nr:ATP-binding protein [Treponema bryantii]SEP69694.1 Signal transduction histidine kinase [Treponema bryantii]
MLKNNRLLRRLFGEQYDIQHRLLNIILLVGILGVAFACFIAVVMHQNPMTQILSFTCLILFFLIFWIANTLKRSQLAIIVFSILFNNFILPSLFISSGGIEGGMPLWCLLGFVFPFLLIKGRSCIVVFIISITEFIVLVIYSYYHPEIIMKMESVKMVLMDMVITMIAVVIIIASIFRYQTHIYQKQQRTIIKTVREANEAIKQKQDFISNISHDIRTPMDSIIGFTELAKKNMDNPEKLADSLEKISRASDHLMNLVNEVLDISKIASGKSVVEEEMCSIHEIIDNVCQILQNEIDNKKLTVDLDFSMLDEDVLSCDSLRLNQILLNLISNAVKYSYEGGRIQISVIQLSTEDESRIVNEFHIRDEGCGMTPEFMEHVFEPFARDKSSPVSAEGTGLGLTIAKSLVEIMGGTIEVVSELGKGSEFTAIIPLSIPQLTEIEEEQDIVIYDFKGRRVLVVDDNQLNREILVEAMREEGFVVDEAIDGSFAIEKLRDSEPGTYELVILDLQMPVMDGYETTRIIRNFQNPKVSEIPIVALTADALPEEKSRAFNCGVNAYLVKPVDMPSLLKVLMLFFRENKRS